MTINKTLATLPSLPSTTRTRPTTGCGCGCGRPTQRTFAPGHDARLKGLILRQIAGIMTNAEIAEWGGEETAKAVEAGIANAGLMKRWNIEIPKQEEEAAS